jgi:transcriptional regulator with XRE-family HTH domain
VRARELVAGTPPDGIAAQICSECGTTMIRAHRLALGITLADVVAQAGAWYQAEGRKPPRFSETLLSAYESGQKRPGPGYLHYLCAVYRADPQDLGYPGSCLCRGRHGTAARPSPALAVPEPAAADQGPSSADDEDLLPPRWCFGCGPVWTATRWVTPRETRGARSSAPSTGSGARWMTRCSPGLPPRP